MIDITDIVTSIIGVMFTIISVIIIPLLKTKLDNNKFDKIKEIIYTTVSASRQLKNSGQLDTILLQLGIDTSQLTTDGEKQKVYVKTSLGKVGIEVNTGDIYDCLIESCVKVLNQQEH